MTVSNFSDVKLWEELGAMSEAGVDESPPPVNGVETPEEEFNVPCPLLRRESVQVNEGKIRIGSLHELVQPRLVITDQALV